MFTNYKICIKYLVWVGRLFACYNFIKMYLQNKQHVNVIFVINTNNIN